MQIRVIGWGAALAAGAIVRLASGQVTYDTVALTGTAGVSRGDGPNVASDQFLSFLDTPAINENGAVAFLGFSGTPSVSSYGGLFTRSGDAAVSAAISQHFPPSIVGLPSTVRFDSAGFFPSFAFNDTGEFALRIFLAGNVQENVDDQALLTNVGGRLRAIGRTAVATPGPNVESVITFANFSNPVLNDAGRIAFAAQLSGSRPAGGNRYGVFVSDAAAAPIIAARNEDVGPGPGLGAGVAFTSVFNSAGISAAGDVTFTALLTGTGVTAANDQVLMSFRAGASTLIASEGDTISASGQNVTLAAPGFFLATTNRPGDVAFGSGSNLLVRSAADGSFRVAAQRATAGTFGPGLGPNVTFDGFVGSNLAINNRGDVAFFANLAGSGVTSATSSGLFLSTIAGEVRDIAQLGFAAGTAGPNLGAGVSLRAFNSEALNAIDTVAFIGVLAGTGITSSNDTALFAWTGVYSNVIARTGDLFDVDPGVGVDLRRITAITFGGPPRSDDGFRESLNDQNVIVYGLTFADGSSGIFTASIPEPASLAATAAACFAGVMRRGRRRFRARV